jgi:DNA-binding NarL/FixJ family response regulator
MRVVIVGPSAARARLIARLPEGIDVVGEAPTLAEARDSAAMPDAWLIASGSALLDPDGVPDEADGLEPLTARELEVVELLAQGLSNKSIASRLGISDQTVKFHVASICGKLGAANRTEAAHKALRRGMIPL